MAELKVGDQVQFARPMTVRKVIKLPGGNVIIALDQLHGLNYTEYFAIVDSNGEVAHYLATEPEDIVGR